ncbi:hypothetical protein VP1G_00459 [Cytospora mali]|uniref:SGNH hydrolase-type esterase domain-containing protein n=1 Tax=Cytospora mali TaxID=578113 RepID=A0A194UN28_CYTMA|nr:hypothetical protein VP1G_00459 [Valsa mali var. pyri (nom. inval.)]
MDKAEAESSATAAARAAKTALKDAFTTAPKSTSTEGPTGDVTEEATQDQWADARKFTRYKLRSLTISREEHLPMVEGASQAISAILLGDSMIERMTTTGKTNSLQLWPSETMFPQMDLEDTNLRRQPLRLPQIVRISGMLNAGCGGDKIENILYRFIGDPEQDLMGLAEALSTPKRKHKVKLWVVQAGTNNLHPKKGLTDQSVQAFGVLLESILNISDVSTHILVTGLFYRKDIKKELVDQANTKLKNLVDEIAREIAPEDTESEQHPAEKSVSRFDFATGTTAAQAIKNKGKDKVDPEERRDSAIGIPISPAVTREGADMKGKGKAKDVPPSTQKLAINKQNGGSSPVHRDPTMPQNKPNRCPIIFEQDPEAVGKRREIPTPTRQGPTESAPTERPSQLQAAGYDYPRIQFLPAPAANDPETWLEDHVHLHEEGYRLWMRKLFPKAKEMLTHAEEASP